MMRVKKSRGIRYRSDVFGGVVYVPERDDFFALDREVAPFAATLSDEWVEVHAPDETLYRAFASLGICETHPRTKQISYSGPSFLGRFIELPTVTDPLVLNCFCTSHCPLMCRYCHADDLMQSYRERESEQDLDNVVATASMIPAMVAVITGGDPLSAPERANLLIRRLSKQKAIVIDTSGVGDIDKLLPAIVETYAHVRVSLDAASAENAKVRPANPKYSKDKDASRVGAAKTIKTCLDNGVPVTVQTVISSHNENFDELRNLRDLISAWGVKNWVLHVAIRGGLARQVEDQADKQTRKRGILPSSGVYDLVEKLIADTERQKIQLDIRCTDTDQTPNSVLLVGSTGDLFTEGLAHHGKIPLYKAEEGRPDLVRSLWHHVDRFGHAKRYFNWNPWMGNGKNLEDICFPISKATQALSVSGATVETEAKFPVRDGKELRKLLEAEGFFVTCEEKQRDEYYDREDKAFSSLDFVIRLRDTQKDSIVGLKGPRFYTESGEYTRVELEFQTKSREATVESLSSKELSPYWFFEKRRTTYRRSRDEATVCLDEIPLLGEFIEVEGELKQIRDIRTKFGECIGDPERRNYAELFSDHMVNMGSEPSEIRGAEFGPIE